MMNPKWAGEDLEELAAAMGKQASAFYGLLPFLPVEDHEWAKRRANEIESHFNATWYAPDTERKERARVYSELIETVRKELFAKLFG